MQALILFIVGLGLVSGTQFKLLPYVYLSNPLSVYQQYQNTRTGEHAYSYAGGPSAKEEIKDAAGVTRGSYSYVDANGILQSVFYVADDNGFRVAATDLPTDDNVSLEPATHVLLARSVKPSEQQQPKLNRRRRSLDASENQSESKQKVEAAASVKTVLAPEATLIQGLPYSTSHQSQVQIHRGVQLEPARPLLKIDAQSLYQPLILSSDIPLATSHQSQVQIHNSANVKLSAGEDKAKQSIDYILPAASSALPLLTPVVNYHENRIELHKQLGIEGPQLKDAVKLNSEPLALVQSPAASVSIAPVLTKEAVLPTVIAQETLTPATASVTTSISSHGISQIHPSTKVVQQPLAVPTLIAKEAVPVAVQETVPVAKLASPTVTTSITSHGVSQVHGDLKLNIEPTLLIKTAPLAQLHPIVDLPLYLH
ncbi:uncharacterized protein LOC116432285 [Nomia melanderi]|uniref:uncharacterized protein LOC116432285 n=1 Tax=Nomia melanderi TaxID=2448451 RepID=UPI00130467F5|nr:uncharacterized protein LOC116432285 [Nomia melanderi]